MFHMREHGVQAFHLSAERKHVGLAYKEMIPAVATPTPTLAQKNGTWIAPGSLGMTTKATQKSI